ncbi:hypothetical protein ACJJTC_018231 [Scirpophaga incertulas]
MKNTRRAKGGVLRAMFGKGWRRKSPPRANGGTQISPREAQPWRQVATGRKTTAKNQNSLYEMKTKKMISGANVQGDPTLDKLGRGLDKEEEDLNNGSTRIM